MQVCLGLRHQEEPGLAQLVSEGLQLWVPCLVPPPLTKFIQVRTGSLLEVSVPPAGRCLDFLVFSCCWLSSYFSEVTVFLALLCSPHIWGMSHLAQLSRSKLLVPSAEPHSGSYSKWIHRWCFSPRCKKSQTWDHTQHRKLVISPSLLGCTLPGTGW